MVYSFIYAALGVNLHSAVLVEVREFMLTTSASWVTSQQEFKVNMLKVVKVTL